MFRFGYSQYMERAFPRDDLRPISCRGKDSQGGIALTLIDSLDTLVVRPCWAAAEQRAQAGSWWLCAGARRALAGCLGAAVLEPLPRRAGSCHPG